MIYLGARDCGGSDNNDAADACRHKWVAEEEPEEEDDDDDEEDEVCNLADMRC